MNMYVLYIDGLFCTSPDRSFDIDHLRRHRSRRAKPTGGTRDFTWKKIYALNGGISVAFDRIHF